MLFIPFLSATGILFFHLLDNPLKRKNIFNVFFSTLCGLLCMYSILWHLEMSFELTNIFAVLFLFIGVLFVVVGIITKKDRFLIVFGIPFILIFFTNILMYRYDLVKYFLD